MSIYEGNLIGNDNKKIAIVVSRFNEFMTKELLEGAINGFKRHGVNADNIDTFWVPGAFEIPFITKQVAKTSKYHGIIALGAVIKGDTTHYDYVCQAATSGISRISLEYDLPIMFGVITTNSIEQAIERSGSKMGNKGYECATSLIEMMSLVDYIKK